MKNILVIAPHPDDEVLGCGGTIAKRVSVGDEIYLCVVTKAYLPEWTEADIKRRREEVFRANKILGIRNIHFLDFPTVKLNTIPHKELDEAISQIVQKVQPEMVFLPHRGDVNQDHRLVFDAAMVAVKPELGSTIKKYSPTKLFPKQNGRHLLERMFSFPTHMWISLKHWKLS